MPVPADLLTDAKNYLDITWCDSAGDVKLDGILARGMTYLDGIVGGALDYAAEGKPREMLFEYARYVRAGQLNAYMIEYLHELRALQAGVGGGDE